MDSDCFYSLDTRLSFDLHPSKLRDVLGSVREQLDALLLHYRSDLSGVVLTYGEERVLSHTARVHGFFPYFNIDVSAKLLIFKLHEGQGLVGTVNKVGPDFIGLLVLGVFNAVIKKDGMPQHFAHDGQAACWASSKQSGHSIRETSEVVFTLKRVDVFGSHFGIEGHLLGKRNGAVAYLRAKKRKKSAAASGAEGADDGPTLSLGNLLSAVGQPPTQATAAPSARHRTPAVDLDEPAPSQPPEKKKKRI